MTSRQLSDDGVTTSRVRRRTDGGVLLRTHRGVYRHAAAPTSWRSRLHAAVLACGDGSLASHRSAARVFGFRDVPLFRPEVTVVGTAKPRHRGIAVHRAKAVDDVDRAVVDGIPVTSVALTVLNLGAVLPFEVVELAAQDAIIRKITSPLDLVSVLERAGGRGKPGTAALRAIIDGCLPSDVLASRLEAEFQRQLKLQRLPEPEWQFEYTCVDGRRVRFDAAWPSARVAAEVDGRLWHSTRRDFDADMARRRSVTASGWGLYSFSYTDIRHRAHVIRETLEAVLLRLSH